MNNCRIANRRTGGNSAHGGTNGQIRCATWAGKSSVMWGPVAKLCKWERPRAPEVRLLFDDARAAPAVLSFLRDTRLGRMVSVASLRERWAGEGVREADSEGEEGGPGPP